MLELLLKAKYFHEIYNHFIHKFRGKTKFLTQRRIVMKKIMNVLFYHLMQYESNKQSFLFSIKQNETFSITTYEL